MLTDAATKALKSQERLYKVIDRDGIYVVVQHRARLCSDATTASTGDVSP